ncbi:hypothetical protein BT96DRAFT_1015657 [Gymnopus androsaceus JB14]|uniref:Restriction endonuclease domain-containing protein n=1 Tax=Gymnopus androsaceus JB14 TaxID=1447944 RepID=A0A6A4I3V0_9AGAR|nr:hypothetical protein BT96DRAFT_1015657 [Gymnopus androsaceus JB14]
MSNRRSVLSELKAFLANPSSTFLLLEDVTWTTFTELEPHFNELEMRQSLRISFIKDSIFVQLMPSKAHETGHRKLAEEMKHELKILDPTPTHAGGVNDVGSATFTHPNLASLEGDTVLVPLTQKDLPRLVIECGDSQSYPSLTKKANNWFQYFPSVHAVIIVKLYLDINKKVVIELWEHAVGGKSLNGTVMITLHTLAPAFRVPLDCFFPAFPPWIPNGQRELVIPAAMMQNYYDLVCSYNA